MNDIVIIGSGLGGYGLAREIRGADPDVPVTVVTADDGAQYSKPMLSNAFAQGKDAAALVQKAPEIAAEALKIAVRPNSRVSGIDPIGHRIQLQGGDSLTYAKLVLALGADPINLPIPGGEQVPVMTVNDLDAYGAWRERIAEGKRVLLIGAGLIGAEFANDLAIAGYKVTVVDPAPWPVARLVPEALGSLLTDSLAEAGIDLRMGRTVARIDPADSGFVATLDDGSEVPVDHALSAIGLAPRTQLAAAAGLECAKGIRIDSMMGTSDPDIYALGDCAESEAGPLPFVAPLLAQAKALAKSLTGTPTPLMLPALPVVVKTPALPLVVCPPKPGAEGDWTVTGEGRNLVAEFIAADGTKLGFALTGETTGLRRTMAKEMPDLLAG
ncbi:NAD(P)/FAD-dependent oxidoreductase [Magnetospira sp. QH-2]|uniref:NAD(P)/FAD-dependent oxidoreductase n=1 Tax=Magnetospira sp. (strain QH-2) TaxID=1288970 RepID=UPI0003E80F53|nr:FAD-dependent oxidoreductase [Magnetospira sp. QH-2]CCQ72394.1 Rubredoxin/ferredoxin-NAD(+) reductase [Magnetospira sp. QH-2]